MCGRYAIHITPEEVEAWFGASLNTETIGKTWNAAPGQNLPVIRVKDKCTLECLKWGLVPNWAQTPEQRKGIINARYETLNERPSFRNLISKNRCIVPACGFFEWKTEGSEKKPRYIHFPDYPVFAMAGLWDYFRLEDSSLLESFTIITIPANPVIQSLHDRMPLILNPEHAHMWLSKGHSPSVLETLAQWPQTLKTEIYPVSQKVNTIRNDGPELIFPLSGGEQISLF